MSLIPPYFYSVERVAGLIKISKESKYKDTPYDGDTSWRSSNLFGIY